MGNEKSLCPKSALRATGGSLLGNILRSEILLKIKKSNPLLAK
jgi:hypothetical protein